MKGADRPKPNLRLRVVREPAKDIYAADKAKIAATDWAALHVASDRRAPIFLPDRPKVCIIGRVVAMGREP